MQQQLSDLEKLAALRDSGVLTEDEFSKAKARIVNELSDPDRPPRWMYAAGNWELIVSVGGCLIIGVATANSGQNHDGLEVATRALLNPLALILFPLSLYWLNRVGKLY